MRRRRRRGSRVAASLAGWLTAMATAVGVARAQSPGPLDTLRTRAERTDYLETSRYGDVEAFLSALAAASPRLKLRSFGYSFEGRSLPLVVVGDAGDGSADAVRATGRTRVLVQATIHAGEVAGKEAVLELLRSLARGEHESWTDSLTLLFAPIYNADGNERVSLAHRPLQYGPLGGMGQRPDARGLDLNRDHMKLESPEARSLVRLYRDYDPQVVVDLHTTDGTVHGYQLTYSPPLNPDTDPRLVSYLRDRWLPWVTREIRRRDGWDFYYYGNLPGREGPRGATERGWYTFDHRPRFNNNYVGLRNRFAILSEAYAYLNFRYRIAATRRFVEEILDFAAAHASEIRRLTGAADATSLVGDSLGVRADYLRSSSPSRILLGKVEVRKNPYSGRPIWLRVDTVIPETMPEFGRFRPTEKEEVPAAYLVPAGLDSALDRLQAHGIRTRRLASPRRLTVQRFRIDSTWQDSVEFQGHRQRTLAGRYEIESEEVPAGTVVVPMDQPLARLAFYLLEPRSDDGLMDWNLLDDSLTGAATYPIVRIPAGAAVP